MEREYKGHSHRKHVDDYCVVDLETTGIYLKSAKIIEISAVRVRNNQVVNEFSTLVNPTIHIPSDITAITHINDDMVKDAPLLEEVLDPFLNFLCDDIIVGYNIASFDLNIIYDSSIKLCGKPFKNDYIDVLHVARRSLTDVDNYKLETISGYYGLDTEGEHRALKDCYLTKEIYDKFFESFGNKAFGKHSSGSRGYYPVRYSSDKHELEELESSLMNLVADGNITYAEAEKLKIWVENHRELLGAHMYDRVYDALDKVLEDGEITQEDLRKLENIFSDIINPVKSRESHDEIKTIEGKHVVVTGDFEYGSREEVYALIENAGGIIDKGVKKATDYLVIGAKGSEWW